MSILRILWTIIVGNNDRAVLLYRISSWCYHHGLRPLATIFWSMNVALHSCDISPAAQIGPGLEIAHSVGIVIGSGVVIGKNLSIFQNVTIGSRGNYTKDNRAFPIIGDNVKLFAGCVIIGPITIGDNVEVGANAVVLDDIPPNSIAIGIPAKSRPKVR